MRNVSFLISHELRQHDADSTPHLNGHGHAVRNSEDRPLVPGERRGSLIGRLFRASHGRYSFSLAKLDVHLGASKSLLPGTYLLNRIQW